MAILPVIVRELQSQARQPLTYWLRGLGGISIVSAFAVAFWSLSGLQTEMRMQNPAGGIPAQNPVHAFGTVLFGKLNLFVFLSIWVLVPMSTADAISRERREGTLALLYLTKLRSWGIVLGKASVHILRALTLFLTMAPWLVLPVLFGGVSFQDVGIALSLHAASLLLALAAGLLASTIPRDWIKAVILAQILALFLMVRMVESHRGVMERVVRAGTPAATVLTAAPFAGLPARMQLEHLLELPEGLFQRTLRLIEFTTNSSLEWSYSWMGDRAFVTPWQVILSNITPAGHRVWLKGVLGMVGSAFLVLLASLAVSAWCVQRSWRDTPPSAQWQEWQRTFLSPRFRVQVLRRNLSRSLSANPIGWLQVYSPSARLVKWGWCLFILAAEILLSGSFMDLYSAQRGLGLVLLAGLAFSATASFRKELENGAFELLLVTPLRERQIILGRVRGLWMQFLPAIVIYGAGSVYLASGWSTGGYEKEAWLSLAMLSVAFLVLPLVGLYFSVWRWNFFVAWVSACLVGALPLLLASAVALDISAIIAVQLALGLTAGLLLEGRLRRREFLAGAG